MANEMANVLGAWWKGLPWVTRHFVVIMAIASFIPLLQMWLGLQPWHPPNTPIWQVLSYVAPPINRLRCCSMSLLIDCLQVSNDLRRLENDVFRSRSRMAFYIFWVLYGANLITTWIGIPFYLPILSVATSYTMAQEVPDEKLLYLFIMIPRRYHILVKMVIGLMVSGGSPRGLVVPLVGVFLAHSFLYFTELLPQAGGPKVVAKGPALFHVLDDMKENEIKRGEYGVGRKLGKAS